MMKKIKTTGIIALWRSTVELFVSYPKLFIPFLILGAIETLALYVLSCSPHFPVSKILAPPIRNIWGEIYLHYPYTYELLPKLFAYAKVVIGIFIGSLVTGSVVYAVSLASKKKPFFLKVSFLAALKRYVSLVFLMAILYFSIHFLMKQPIILIIKYFRSGKTALLFMGPKVWANTLLPVVRLLLAVFLQGFFVFAIPFIMLKGKKFIAALFSGIVLFLKNCLKVLVVVLVPMIFYVPLMILKSNLSILEAKSFPEIVVFVLFASILVGTVLVDAFITVSTTLLFIEATDEK